KVGLVIGNNLIQCFKGASRHARGVRRKAGTQKITAQRFSSTAPGPPGRLQGRGFIPGAKNG
ncbi:MAG: hypothetical protein ACLQU1_16455, partial [Bryobacteraceae bacterium]